jgi:hypothetical protein
MATIQIHRAGDLYNKPGKRGIFNVGRTTFYDVIEPHLERVELAPHAVGYTDRSVAQKIKAGIAAASRRDPAQMASRRRARG